jgi:hypothetical protein
MASFEQMTGIRPIPDLTEPNPILSPALAE